MNNVGKHFTLDVITQNTYHVTLDIQNWNLTINLYFCNRYWLVHIGEIWHQPIHWEKIGVFLHEDFYLKFLIRVPNSWLSPEMQQYIKCPDNSAELNVKRTKYIASDTTVYFQTQDTALIFWTQTSTHLKHWSSTFIPNIRESK